MIRVFRKKKTWSILLFFAVAVVIRAVCTPLLTSDSSHQRVWDLMVGISPVIGGLVAILLLRRKMIPSVVGKSIGRSLITLAAPFVVFGVAVSVSNIASIGTVAWVMFLCLLYAFFEEVGMDRKSTEKMVKTLVSPTK